MGGFINGDEIWLAINANNAHDALGVVDLGNQIKDDATSLGNGFSQIIVVMIIRHIRLLLLAIQRFAADVAGRQLAWIKDANDLL